MGRADRDLGSRGPQVPDWTAWPLSTRDMGSQEPEGEVMIDTEQWTWSWVLRDSRAPRSAAQVWVQSDQLHPFFAV